MRDFERRNKNMNELKKNEQFELLLAARTSQPEIYRQLTPTQKMAIGIYENEKERAPSLALTTDDVLRLRGLKQRLATDVLSPLERSSLAIEILNLENK
jgi:hypothetical protein